MKSKMAGFGWPRLVVYTAEYGSTRRVSRVAWLRQSLACSFMKSRLLSVTRYIITLLRTFGAWASAHRGSGVLGVYAVYQPPGFLTAYYILTSAIINKQGTFRPFAMPVCVYPPPFLAIHCIGVNVVSWPPWKNGWKIKKAKTRKKQFSRFTGMLYFESNH